MKQSDAELQADISKVRSLRGFIDNDKRLSYALDSEEVAEVPDTEHVRFCRDKHFLKYWQMTSNLDHILTTEIYTGRYYFHLFLTNLISVHDA